MKNIRRNSITGIVEHKGLTDVSLHFSEWWNGEGMDFTFDENKSISLHGEELHALIVAAMASEYIDMDSVKEDVDWMILESRRREKEIEEIRSNYVGN